MPTFDRRLIYHFDWALFGLVIGLAALGIVSVISASYAGPHKPFNPLVVRQLIWVAIGAALMLGIVFLDYRVLATYAYPIYGAAIALLALVAVAGRVTGGSRRWINLGLFKLEPSELVKLALVLVLVRFMRDDPPRGGWGFKAILLPALLLAVPVVLVLRQPDLGTAIMLVLIAATLVFVGGFNWRTLVVIGLAAILAAPVGWHYMKPYQRQRLVTFLNPESDPLGAGYHIIQSEIAIGAGGEFGKGFLKGTQAQLNFLPEETTDFIFSVFAEQFGFVGAILLLALYAMLIWRGTWIARHARDRFGALLALGVTAMVFWQVAINIGMTSGVLPVVGIPLPLVSYGGSSMLVLMVEMGLLISINTRRYLF